MNNLKSRSVGVLLSMLCMVVVATIFSSCEWLQALYAPASYAPIPPPKKNDTYHLEVTSDGTNYLRWIDRLKGKGVFVNETAEEICDLSYFNPTKGVTVEVVVLEGALFPDSARTVENIRAEADKRGLVAPHPEVAFLIREQLTNEQIEAMGMRGILIMHEPFTGTAGPLSGGAYLLGVGIAKLRDVKRSRPALFGYNIVPVYHTGVDELGGMKVWYAETQSWSRDTGFAFVVPHDPRPQAP